jgi:hypothetical protein
MKNLFAWDLIFWKEVKMRTIFLQSKIFNALVHFNFRKARNIRRLFVSSFSACLVAVKFVSEEDLYRFIFGIDSEVWVFSNTRFRAVINICSGIEISSPLRKVLLRRNGFLRLFFIPSFKVRTFLVLYKFSFFSFFFCNLRNEIFLSSSFLQDFQKLRAFLKLQTSSRFFLSYVFFKNFSSFLINSCTSNKFLVNRYTSEVFNFIFICNCFSFLIFYKLRKFYLNLILKRFISYKFFFDFLLFNRSFLFFQKSFFSKRFSIFFIEEFFLSKSHNLNNFLFFDTFVNEKYFFDNFDTCFSLIENHIREIRFFSKNFSNQGKVFSLVKFLNFMIKSWFFEIYFLDFSYSFFLFLDYFIYKILWNFLRKKHYSKSSFWIFNKYWKFVENNWVFFCLNDKGEVYFFSSYSFLYFSFLKKSSIFNFFDSRNLDCLKKNFLKRLRFEYNLHYSF